MYYSLFGEVRMSNCESESDWSDAPELEEDETTTCRSLFSLFEGSVEECLASDKRVFGWSLGISSK